MKYCVSLLLIMHVYMAYSIATVPDFFGDYLLMRKWNTTPNINIIFISF